MLKAGKSGIFGKIISQIQQRQAASKAAAQPQAQAPQGPAERASPFSARPRGQAANILAGEERSQMRQKRLLGE